VPRIGKDFFASDDVVAIAEDLLGVVLYSNTESGLTAGRIVETEAYRAPEDQASHAWNNRRTARTEVMFGAPGVAYVYICYGIHHLFNIITGPIDTPHAVLIRALEPVEGIEIMMTRRKMDRLEPKLTAGPGSLSVAMGFEKGHTGTVLYDPDSFIWLEDQGKLMEDEQVIASTRVGVESAGESAKLPWRFRIRGNPWTSPAK
jgi:DNA-3-methyladenine glycosylase